MRGDRDRGAGGAQPARPAPLAVAVVIEGDPRWLGPLDHAPRSGVAVTLPRALGELARAPDGAVGELLLYGGAPIEVVPFGELRRVARAFDPPPRLHLDEAHALVDAAERALADLGAAHAARKVLIVIGDGQDARGDDAVPAMRALRDRAAAAHVVTYAIAYRPEGLDGDARPLRALAGDGLRTANSMDGVAAQLGAIVRELTGDPAPGAAPPPGVAAAARPWWPWLLLGAGVALALVALGVVRRARRASSAHPIAAARAVARR